MKLEIYVQRFEMQLIIFSSQNRIKI